MKLVAYFSATGTTEKLAERVASVLKADIFEIKPKEPYTRDDLNWNNQNSRSSKEMNNRSFRPEIKEKLANIEDYDTIYIGFPIWWYIAPTIINTFLESYDLTGKTIIPFATSGGSGMGNTNKELKDSCKGAILKEGKRLRVTASDEEIEELGKN
jgi:hypothetical protein